MTSSDAPSTLPASTEGPSFAELGLPAKVVEALAKIKITHPTPCRPRSSPTVSPATTCSAGRRPARARRSRSGCRSWRGSPAPRSRPKHPRALIVVPTRELATQVRRSLEPLAFAARLKLTTVYGGTSYDRQIKQLRAGADIVVATPGRLQDLMDRGHCLTDDIEITVLDEADHLCDLGFYPAVDQLMGQTPAGSQRMLLSATLDGDVDKLVRTHLRDPRLHQLDPNAGAVTTMDHHVMVVGGFRDKVDAVTALVEASARSIVFTRTREGATELRDALGEREIEAVDLHGNLSQRVRERNLHKFSSGKARAVVATDVAARGIHVDNVGLVVHFDAPTDAKGYLHRSGRTARAGESGTVVTITTPRQLDEVARLQSRAGVQARHHDIRTTPRPMTSEMLAESGTEAPPVRGSGGSGPRNGRSGGRPQGGGYRGSRPSYTDRPRRDRDDRAPRGRDDRAPRGRDERPARSWEDRPARTRDERPARTWEDRPARAWDERGESGQPAQRRSRPGATRPDGKKARWSATDKKRSGAKGARRG